MNAVRNDELFSPDDRYEERAADVLPIVGENESTDCPGDPMVVGVRKKIGQVPRETDEHDGVVACVVPVRGTITTLPGVISGWNIGGSLQKPNGE